MLAGSLSLAGLSVLTDSAALGAPARQDTRPLTPTFYQWIDDLHPGIESVVNPRFDNLNFQIAPVQGFGVERFVAEARNQESTWDVYVGTTPFVEMVQLKESGAIEPWDPFIPQEVVDDMIPSIREEGIVDGQRWAWPFLLDVIVQSWHAGILTEAGLEDAPAATWTEYLERAQAIVESGAAPFGATFDARGWRSLAPFTHSLSTDVYTEEGLFDFRSEPAIEALKLMKDIMQFANPDILLEGASDGGVNDTPDEAAWAAERAGQYTKYQNAPIRFAENWVDPDQVRLGPLPSFEGGEGSTVFWTTGAALFRFGQNKEAAAEYMTELTYDMQIWQDSIAGTETGRPMQLPPYQSIYAEWEANPPAWLPDFVGLVRGQLDVAKAIPNHLFGLQQFVIGKPVWETFLTDEESDPAVAMQNAWDAVQAEINRDA
ncbi:MAG: extracellular solute-binding protein [Chloroflexi bacterium]|nr:MAG: extracellular solute-binding protein [Chloroflexota bacterium]